MPLTGEHHRYRAILPPVWIKGKASCHRPVDPARYILLVMRTTRSACAGDREVKPR
jgi:hypothetical protein